MRCRSLTTCRSMKSSATAPKVFARSSASSRRLISIRRFGSIPASISRSAARALSRAWVSNPSPHSVPMRYSPTTRPISLPLTRRIADERGLSGLCDTQAEVGHLAIPNHGARSRLGGLECVKPSNSQPIRGYPRYADHVVEFPRGATGQRWGNTARSSIADSSRAPKEHQIIMEAKCLNPRQCIRPIKRHHEISKCRFPKPGVRGSSPLRDATLHTISDR